MSKLNRVLVVLSLLCVVFFTTGCGNSQIFGKIKDISSKKITIETGRYEQQQKGQGDKSGSVSKATFRSDKKEAGYPLSRQINTDGLSEGSLVKLTLEDETVTAIELVQADTPSDKTSSASEPADAQHSAVFRVSGKRSGSTDKNYSTGEADTNAILVDDKGFLNLKGGTLTKSGDTADKNESRLHGLNSVFTASGGSRASISGTTLTSSGSGAVGIFSTGRNSRIRARDIKIYTTGDEAGGLCATYNGRITLSSGNISTKGNRSIPITVPASGGLIKVSDAAAVSEGKNSPCLYSAGIIRGTNLTGNASSSPIAYLKESGRIRLDGCIMQGAGKNGIIFSGNDSAYTKEEIPLFKASNSTLIATSEGSMFRIQDTSASVVLQETTLYADSNILAEVSGSAKKEQAAVNTLTLKGIRQQLSGQITCDPYSKAVVKLTQGSQYCGAVNTNKKAAAASVSLDKSSCWELTGDSYLSKFSNEDKQCRNIRSNGYSIYYDANKKANKWLCGKVLPLPGGGKLSPVN